MTSPEPVDAPLLAVAAEPEGMIDERGNLPTWDVLHYQDAQLDVASKPAVVAVPDSHDQQRRSAARWGVLGAAMGLTGVLIGVVAQVVLAGGPGLVVAIGVGIVEIVLIGFGYFRFWAPGRN